MLDGLSVVASVITIVEAISQAVKYARAFYRAPKEFEALQRQIDQFTNILQEIDGQQGLLSPTVITALSTAREILEQLNKLLKDKIIRDVSGSSRIQRRAWANYRTKIYGIQHSLADYKANLLIAIVANSSPSAARSEAMLISISREVGVLHSTLHSISASSGSLMYPTPTTALESSRHYFPETYTLDSQVPRSCLMVLASCEKFRCPDNTTNVYELLYLGSPRQWHWLTLSLQIPSSSRYRLVTKISHRESRKWPTLTCAETTVLPHLLVTQIQSLLCRSGNIKDNTRLCLSVLDDDTAQQKLRIVQNDTILTSPTLSTSSLGALNYLHDLGCNRYVEEDVVQIRIIGFQNCFVSTIKGKLVCEIFSRGPTPAMQFLYNIRVLHCMDGVPGFAKLIGIVTDNGGKRLKSYLIEFPKARWNILQLVGKPTISWERRERWASQLIQGISHMHTKGFVVGGMTIWCSPVIMDDTDTILFWTFTKKLVTGRKGGAYYPPELRHVRGMCPKTSEADLPGVTPKTDIFHLGLLLWLLAENKPITHSSPVCMRERCNSFHDNPSDFDLSHAEPIDLPELPENIPLYYRNIVKLCRAEKPGDRPAARELLGMFPFVSKVQGQQEVRESYRFDMDTLGDGFRVLRMTCDRCGKRPISLPFFHCNVCSLGDFDLCQKCHVGGMHCYNDSHLLVELVRIGSWVVPQKYYSCVKRSGVRDVVDI